MWGTWARDSLTIPSLLARELGGRGIASEIVNFGESGYVSTQEVVALMLRLQRGEIPDVVIFYDGVNDVFSAFQHQAVGLPQNEANRAREFNLTAPEQFPRRVQVLIQDLARRSYTVRAVKALLRKAGVWREPEARVRPARSDSLAQAVVDVYRGNLELVGALGREYGFSCLFYWQPTVYHKKQLTPFERGQLERVKDQRAFYEETTEALGRSGLAETDAYHFHDLTLLFADVRQPVFVDWCHISEWGNGVVARRMAEDVVALRSRARSGR